MLRLMCCYNVETSDSIILRCLIKHQEIFFTRSVKGVIRNTHQEISQPDNRPHGRHHLQLDSGHRKVLASSTRCL
jgi:hypothetical protein